MSGRELELLHKLREDVQGLGFKQNDTLDALKRRADMLIRNIFGGQSKYLHDLQRIAFHPSVWIEGMTADDARPSWDSGRDKFVNLVNTLIKEIEIFRSPKGRSNEDSGEKQPSVSVSTSVFIVHGHDEEMKQAVARMIEKLGLQATILHEQPSQGRTVIEKLMDHSTGISFAIVLLSPDDLAYKKGQDPSEVSYRARQNVVFELGFFLGKLGRSRVVALHRQVHGFEMPSDYSGVLYVPYDDRGTWQLEILRELKAAGYQADANRLT